MAFFGTPYPRLQDDRIDRLAARRGPEHQPFYDALDRIAAARDDVEFTS